MSTNSLIMRPSGDNFDTRYHHYDGYPEGLGVFLERYFNSKEKVDWLFDLNKDFTSIMIPKDNHKTILQREIKIYNKGLFPNLYNNYKMELFSKNKPYPPIKHSDSASLARNLYYYNYIFEDNKWFLCRFENNEFKKISIINYNLWRFAALKIAEDPYLTINDLTKTNGINLKTFLSSMNEFKKAFDTDCNDVFEMVWGVGLEDFDFEGATKPPTELINDMLLKNNLDKALNPIKSKKPALKRVNKI